MAGCKVTLKLYDSNGNLQKSVELGYAYSLNAKLYYGTEQLPLPVSGEGMVYMTLTPYTQLRVEGLRDVSGVGDVVSIESELEQLKVTAGNGDPMGYHVLTVDCGDNGSYEFQGAVNNVLLTQSVGDGLSLLKFTVEFYAGAPAGKL